MIRNASDPASRQFVWAIFGIGHDRQRVVVDLEHHNRQCHQQRWHRVRPRPQNFFQKEIGGSAFAAYRWPTYPFLIMLVGNIAGATLPNLEDPYKFAGHVLNTFFFSLAVMLFVAVVRGFGGTSRRITWIALFVALIHPAFNEYRAFLIRDPGYLAAYLLAVYYLTQCRYQPGFRYPSRCDRKSASS